ncbi:hypothetical protein G3N56_02300 [Desulfovibrio sulfodismutans]|uniref:HAF repeat-containing protein n=1 Tax=Desulfolutivibrio sulfodismutans TaxID=63561 RepID=A0A7K3NH98_9BACT|nr:hypothetical protein [Desulfolutivibrio sulfodismutans]NDY55576.1 hypothetical protein [Desulfolutivibrio sulfodismutans]QLA11477.1 hypothetical protein GD606_03895 [Desulfolutivibrio sulfodismutans DSM 3696]
MDSLRLCSVIRSRMYGKLLFLVLLACVYGVFLPGMAQSAFPTYTIIDLGALGGEDSESQAAALNDLGVVVGWSGTATGDIHAFRYENGMMTDLGVLSGGTNSYATGINHTGQIVGKSYTTSSGLLHAFLYQNEVMTDLGVLPGGDFSYATGINNAGEIVGKANTVSGSRAFLYSNGNMTNIGLPPDPLPSTLPPGATWVWMTSEAAAISPLGHIVGSAIFLYNQPPTIANFQCSKAFTYPIEGTLYAFSPHPQDGAAYDAFATAINATDQIVGYAFFTNPFLGPAHAFLRQSDGELYDLGTLGGDRSFAYGINASGQIVGKARKASGVDAAFVYAQGVMMELATRITGSSPFASLESALAISDSGSIVGSGMTHDGIRHAFLALPSPPPPVQGGLTLLLLSE